VSLIFADAVIHKIVPELLIVPDLTNLYYIAIKA
jgi:hypothetical protein